MILEKSNITKKTYPPQNRGDFLHHDLQIIKHTPRLIKFFIKYPHNAFFVSESNRSAEVNDVFQLLKNKMFTDSTNNEFNQFSMINFSAKYNYNKYSLYHLMINNSIQVILEY